MKVIAKTTLPEFNVTGGNVYEVVKEIESPEIGLMYRIIDDTQKPTNLRAIHFRREDEAQPPLTMGTSELIELHRKQFAHNRDALLSDLNSIFEMFNKNDETVNIGDVNGFIDDAREYLMAMMFHANSLRCVGLDVIS